MNKIRIKNKELYEIEVNDNGDKISFDFKDPAFPLTLLECYDKVTELTKRMEKERKEILSREDKPYNDIASQNEKDLLELRNNFYIEMRDVLDLFLGKGACKKIFGDNNWDDMIEDLFEALAPEFDKMGIDFTNLQKKVANKYKNESTEII